MKRPDFFNKLRPLHALLALAAASALALGACGGNDDSPVTTTTVTAPATSTPAPVPTPTPTVVSPATTTITIARALLSGDQEPTPTNTGALGTGTLQLEMPSRTVRGTLTLQGMTGTVAHIHIGEVGVNGPVIVDLAQTAPGSGIWTVAGNGVVVTEAQAAAVMAGGLYFNAHSAEFPGGEIRGQIGRSVLAAQMSAGQEVPTNASTATGTGFVTLDAATGRIAARLTLFGMTGTVAHIHAANVGTNGPVIVDLTQTAPGSGIWLSAPNATLTSVQMDLLSNGGLYFNAHSARFPGGEIRGQIGRNVRFAALDAAQEVPTNASVATGTGSLVINPLNRAVVGGEIALTGVVARAAHVHTGATGVNGPVIVDLSDQGNGIWSVPANASASLTAEQFKAFKQGNLYFNAHSAAFPGGEIRGQIR